MNAVKRHPIRADLYISLHQDNPFEFNVGFYMVFRANATLLLPAPDPVPLASSIRASAS